MKTAIKNVHSTVVSANSTASKSSVAPALVPKGQLSVASSYNYYLQKAEDRLMMLLVFSLLLLLGFLLRIKVLEDVPVVN